MILDVGCGCKPRGDVNVDLFTGNTPHIRGDAFIDGKRIRNFVRADIHYLPFKNRQFSRVLCYSVLEHVGVVFARALKELCRVCNGIVVFHVPHRFHTRWEMHDKIFSIGTLDVWIRKQGYYGYRLKTIYKEYPSRMLPLFRLPWIIEATLIIR